MQHPADPEIDSKNSNKPKLRALLGDLLVAERVITREQLSEALKHQQETGQKLGEIFIEMKMVSPDQMLFILARQLDLEVLNLDDVIFSDKVHELIPQYAAEEYGIIAISENPITGAVVVAMADPANPDAVDAVYDILAPHPVELAVARSDQVYRYIRDRYLKTDQIHELAAQLKQENISADELSMIELGDLVTDDDATVALFIKNIFEDAMRLRASDIHIEPEENMLRVRYRVDGKLMEFPFNQRGIASAIVNKLKIMSDLSITIKRLPQDGRFKLPVADLNTPRRHGEPTKRKMIEVRLSTIPVEHGEGCVMRILDQSAGILSFEQMGMPESIRKRFEHHLRSPYGLILVTGPTGSGKTTTLYSALHQLNTPERKIITVEDPVEYRMERLTQVQINADIGLSFARVLRTTLRQDPDVILIGEMRDQETAEIGLRGSITGHLVLSTLHTNDAPTSAMRLVDMGAEPFLVANALKAVLAQRLVRRICSECKESYTPAADQLRLIESMVQVNLSQVEPAPERNDQNQYVFYRGKGCNNCHRTGYRGRVGVYEFLEINDDMRLALQRNRPDEFNQAVQLDRSFNTLTQAALTKAISGDTTLEEVLSLVAGLPYVDDEAGTTVTEASETSTTQTSTTKERK